VPEEIEQLFLARMHPVLEHRSFPLLLRIRLLEQILVLVIAYQPRAAVRGPGFNDKIRTNRQNSHRYHLSFNHYISEKSPFCRTAEYIWTGTNPWWWGLKPQFGWDQTSNHTNISECKHMQGMKQIFEWDRPRKIPALQLLYQWTVELPLALKLPRCATCVQWIVLISGPDQN
jgi:hypothetical protein